MLQLAQEGVAAAQLAPLRPPSSAQKHSLLASVIAPVAYVGAAAVRVQRAGGAARPAALAAGAHVTGVGGPVAALAGVGASAGIVGRTPARAW